MKQFLESNLVESFFAKFLTALFAKLGIVTSERFRFECFIDYRPANPKQEKGNGRAVWSEDSTTLLVKADGPDGRLVESAMIRAGADSLRKAKAGAGAQSTGPIPAEFTVESQTLFDSMATPDLRDAIARFVLAAKKVSTKRTMLSLRVSLPNLKPIGLTVQRKIEWVDAIAHGFVAGTKVQYRDAEGKYQAYDREAVVAMFATDTAPDVSGQKEETIKGKPEHGTNPAIESTVSAKVVGGTSR